MERNEKARNDDQYLVLKLWKEFYNFNTKFPLQHIVDLDNVIRDYDSYDQIVRCRRMVQSKMSKNYRPDLLPTDEHVIKKRKLYEEVFRVKELGYSH